MSPLFCAVAARLDLLPVMFTPFLRISIDLPRRNKIIRWLEPLILPGKPVIVQLMGDNPGKLAGAVGILYDYGIREFNLNFACPSGQVLSSGAGGALLKNPDLMRRIMLEIRHRYPEITLSAKLRTGFADSAEADKIIPVFSDCADFLAIHYRTVKEGYREIGDGLERLSRITSLTGLPVVGNGDVNTPEDARKMLETTGCAGIMCARGLLKDPFLLKRLANSTVPDVISGKKIFFQTALELAEECYDEFWSKPHLLELARFIWGVSSPEFRELIAIDEFTPDNIKSQCSSFHFFERKNGGA